MRKASKGMSAEIGKPTSRESVIMELMYSLSCFERKFAVASEMFWARCFAREGETPRDESRDMCELRTEP